MVGGMAGGQQSAWYEYVPSAGWQLRITVFEPLTPFCAPGITGCEFGKHGTEQLVMVQAWGKGFSKVMLAVVRSMHPLLHKTMGGHVFTFRIVRLAS